LQTNITLFVTTNLEELSKKLDMAENFCFTSLLRRFGSTWWICSYPMAWKR